MAITAPNIDVKDAMALIARLDERADLSHLQVKKYRNFLTLYSFDDSKAKRHARLALREDSTWQLHLPVAADEWETTGLAGSFSDLMRMLFDDYGVELGLGACELRTTLTRDGYLSHGN